MKNYLLTLFAVCCIGTSYAQTGSDFNYSIGLRAFSIMQMPKILNEVENDKFTKLYVHGGMFKFNDNQISYRLSGSYYRGDKTFNNNCVNCQVSEGKVEDYVFKVGFEKNFNYSRIQPYFGFDLGFRSNKYSGMLSNTNPAAMASSLYIPPSTVQSMKDGLILAPLVGVKINVIDQLSIFAESNLDVYYSYERQDIVAQDANNTQSVNRFRKWEYLVNPVSVGIFFHISSKN
ncbi:hypothetical protein C7T94_15220 [Pedobacter yulinensis]|uniref:Outer membrane protein beta-barrel domain-containing protein n=1 Tax=Pedobacter yulinensis TaxID=2126353 RepID=A0A2T3HI89_9SPHI|nr:hypothetical protein [Pedobacter yulinensis]PST82152.1 hypothetical protein C7T94_15220 [Pedobacter yulinensis]